MCAPTLRLRASGGTNHLNFCWQKRAWVEIHNDCVFKDFTSEFRERYVCGILEHVIVTIFSTLELHDEAMCYTALG